MGASRPTVRNTLVFLLLWFSANALGDVSLWSEISSAEPYSDVAERSRAGVISKDRQLRINREGLNALIEKGLASPQGTFILHLPRPDGAFAEFEFQPSGTMSPGLARKFPDIRAFSGRSLDRGTASARMEVTPAGVSVQVLASEGRWMIDPSDVSDPSMVKSYFGRNAHRLESPFQCGVSDRKRSVRASKKNPLKAKSPRATEPLGQSRSRGSELRTYRLAVATTGEYGAYHGGSVDGALSAVVRVINRVNGIFNAELAVGFELIEANEAIIFTDPDTDPFEGNLDPDILIDESQAVIDDLIGTENYDIGHTFAGDGGGLASTGPCQDGYKASGVTGGTEGDAFAVDYVAHEIGHQFGMDHTFNTSSDDCLENRSASAAFEPGAGSTIMSYNGLCNPDNLAQAHLPNNNSDPIFHSYSFEQAVDYLQGEGASCGVASATGNTRPNADAGRRYTVPSGTPLYLEGVGSDPDGGVVTYAWEQRDLGVAAALTTLDDGAIPLFRAYAPTTHARRYLPKLASVVSGNLDNTEKIPRKPRTMAWALTVRDDDGGRSSDITEIEVVAEPLVGKTFSVAEPDQGGSLGAIGTVRWHVGETNQAPISANEVELYLSIDGGQSFPSTPFATVANDGYARVNFPTGISTDNARIMVKGRDNVFFDVSDADFSLNSSLAATPEVPAPKNVSGAGVDPDGIAINFSPGAGSGVNFYDAVCAGAASTAGFSGSASPNQDFSATQPATSVISLTESGSVSPEGVQVFVDIAHEYRGDVVITLTTPSGMAVELKGFDPDDQAIDVLETYLVRGVVGEDIAGRWQLEVSDGFELDDGRFNGWSLSGTSVTPPRVVKESVEPKLPFGYLDPVSSALQLEASGDVSPDEFEVSVDITHGWRSDVVLELETPSGTRLILRNEDEDDSADDVKGTFPTTLKSKTPFSQLAGEPLSGAWTLHVSDQFSSDDGVLNGWAISQNQYVFTARGVRSPIRVEGLPGGQSYDCRIAGVYSDVTPPRQSQTVAAGKITPGAKAGGSGVEETFLNLLRTVLALDPSTARDSDAAAKSRERSDAMAASAMSAQDRRPIEVPALGFGALKILMLLVGLLGLMWGPGRVARPRI
jgi:subtilisin-like proprotein convertase family protein